MELDSLTKLVAVMATSTTAFFLLNKGLNHLPAPPRYAETTRRRKWRNAVTSTIHAGCVTVCGVISIYSKPELLVDPLNVSSSTMVLSAVISNGYFIYDFIDLAMNMKLRDFLPLMTHHLMAIGFSIWFLWAGKLHGLCALTTAVEFQGIFLHARHLLLMYDFSKDDIFYRVNGAINVVTYVVCRLGVFTYDFWWLCTHTAETGFLLPIPVVILLILNTVLFYRLIKSDYIGKSGVYKSKENDIMVG